jgi:hypothetical protein
MRAILMALVAAACAELPRVEPAPFEKRPTHELAGTVADRVDPYTRRDEAARRMRQSGFCPSGRRYAPCYRGTVLWVRFAYRGERVVGLELTVPGGRAPADVVFAAHRRALEERFGPPAREEPLAAAWRLAGNWRIRLERGPRGAVRELHSYLP